MLNHVQIRKFGVGAARGALVFASVAAVIGFVAIALSQPNSLAAKTPSTTTTLGVAAFSCASTKVLVSGSNTIDCPSPPGKWGSPPTLVIPKTNPPSKLEIADLIKGYGPKVKTGDTLIVEYELATYSTHRVVESSWLGPSFMFTVGQGEVNEGWNLGVVGMQAGGRREIVVPPTFGYGKKSPGPGISRNDTLVYIVDMFKIN